MHLLEWYNVLDFTVCLLQFDSFFTVIFTDLFNSEALEVYSTSLVTRRLDNKLLHLKHLFLPISLKIISNGKSRYR